MLQLFLILCGVAALLYVVLRIILLLAGLTALLSEVRPVQRFETAAEEEAGPRSSYGTRVAEVAHRLGFRSIGTARLAGGVDAGARIDLWCAPDNCSIAVVEAGPADVIPYRNTVLYSRTEREEPILSSDTPDEGDLCRLRGLRIRLDATFEELWSFHQGRLADVHVPLQQFDPECALEQVHHIEAERVAGLVQRGLAHYRDRQGQCWSYTFRGALRVYFEARLTQLKDLQRQERLRLLKPQVLERE